jgi:hypothetical protein
MKNFGAISMTRLVHCAVIKQFSQIFLKMILIFSIILASHIIIIFSLAAVQKAKDGATLENIHLDAAKDKAQIDAQKLAERNLQKAARARGKTEQEREYAQKGK